MGEVRFVRIRGRIVPIRKKEDRKKVGVGAAQIAAGATAAYGSGYFGGKMFKSALNKKNIVESSVDVASDLMLKIKKTRKTGARIPKGQMSFASLEISKAAKAAPKFRSRMFMSGKILKYGGHGLGAVWIGSGFQKIYEGLSGKEAGVLGETSSALAGYGTMRLITGGFKKGAGKGLLKLLSKGKIK